MIVCFADLPVEWQTDHTDFVKDFVSDTMPEPVINVRFAEKLSECYGVQYADMPCSHVLRLSGGELLCADESWSKVTSFFSPAGGEYALALAAVCSRFSYFGTLLFHASCVDYNGKGILFTGASGIGKTTQAELWQRFKGAEIINGDKAFVRCTDEGIFAYGLPWKGSSEYCLNRKTQLKGIVVLSQSDENRITKLTSAEIMQLCMPNAFLPHWDKNCLNHALDSFEKLMNNIPVWLLSCRPDEDAVKLTYDTVFSD